MKSEDDVEFIMASVNSLYGVLNTLCVARHSEDTQGIKYIVFCRNVLVNLVGNFIINKTDYSLKDSLETNIDYFIEDIKKFFEHYRVTGKELQS